MYSKHVIKNVSQAKLLAWDANVTTLMRASASLSAS
jgi:hypothetical protein